MSNNQDKPDWVQVGDNTLHGAIDYWTGRASRLAAENEALRAERDEMLSLIYEAREVTKESIEEIQRLNKGNEALRVERDNAVMRLNRLQCALDAVSVTHIKAQGARELLNRATAAPNFSSTVVRVDLMQKIIGRMEKLK